MVFYSLYLISHLLSSLGVCKSQYFFLDHQLYSALFQCGLDFYLALFHKLNVIRKLAL